MLISRPHQGLADWFWWLEGDGSIVSRIQTYRLDITVYRCVFYMIKVQCRAAPTHKFSNDFLLCGWLLSVKNTNNRSVNFNVGRYHWIFL